MGYLDTPSVGGGGSENTTPPTVLGVQEQEVDLGGNAIKNVADPVDPADAATLSSVEDVVAGAGGGAAAPRSIFVSDLVNASRYHYGNTETGHTLLTDGAIVLYRGTGTTDGSSVKDYSGQYLTPVWDLNPSFWASFDGGAFAAGNSYDANVLMDGIMHGSDAPAGKYMGFRVTNRLGVKGVEAVHCDGTNPEVTTAIAGVDPAFNTHSYHASMTSGTDIKFYVNGALVATHTTNLPSGTMSANALYGAQVRGLAGTSDQVGLYLRTIGLSYDAFSS